MTVEEHVHNRPIEGRKGMLEKAVTLEISVLPISHVQRDLCNGKERASKIWVWEISHGAIVTSNRLWVMLIVYLVP